MLAGGVIGCGLGLMSGVIFYVLLSSINETQEKRHYWHIQKLLREQKEVQALGGGGPPKNPVISVLDSNQASS